MTTPAFHPFRSEEARARFHALYEEKSKNWPLPPETRFVETASARTFVRVAGRADDPPLVLLPGARGSSLMWVPNIAALSAHYRTYALDLVNDIGLSVPRRDPRTPADLLEWLHEVVCALEPERPVHVAGVSYGGWLTGLYALHHPENVGRAVLLAPGGAVLRVSGAFFLKVLLLMLPLPGRARRERRSLDRLVRWLFEDTFRAGGPMQALVEREFLAMLMAGKELARPRMIWPTVFRDEEWRRFRVKALFLVGENEKVYSPAAAVARLARVAPLVRSEVIPGAGHDLMMVQADLVHARIHAFLSEPAPAAAPAAAQAVLAGRA